MSNLLNVVPSGNDQDPGNEVHNSTNTESTNPGVTTGTAKSSEDIVKENMDMFESMIDSLIGVHAKHGFPETFSDKVYMALLHLSTSGEVLSQNRFTWSRFGVILERRMTKIFDILDLSAERRRELEVQFPEDLQTALKRLGGDWNVKIKVPPTRSPSGTVAVSSDNEEETQQQAECKRADESRKKHEDQIEQAAQMIAAQMIQKMVEEKAAKETTEPIVVNDDNELLASMIKRLLEKQDVVAEKESSVSPRIKKARIDESANDKKGCIPGNDAEPSWTRLTIRWLSGTRLRRQC
jgi:hypothetical protein